MKKGFTLIEMLGIVTVLATILLVVTPILNKSLKQLKNTSESTNYNNLKESAEAYIELNRDKYPELYNPGSSIQITVQDLYNANLLKGKKENLDNNSYITIIANEDHTLSYYYNGTEIGINKNDITDENLTMEISLIKSKMTSEITDGIYYYNSSGNLENGTNIIYLNHTWTSPRGNILIHNHQFISGCLTSNNKNYDYYKGELTQKNYPCSTVRGENLVINGDLSYHDNTNFSSFTYVAEEGTNGYLTKTVSSTTTKPMDQFIPVDANKNYEIGFTAKANNSDSTYYIGLIPYNENKEQLLPNNVMYINDTLTTLSHDLNNGDEYVYLTNMTNWKTNSTESQGYYKGFIFWNYVDSTGYQYPELTYSKNYWKNLYENENIDKENNRIKLNATWDKGYIPAGTKLSQSSEGSAWLYTIRNNAKLAENYETYSAVIGSINNSYYRSATKFDPGTKYIKFAIRQNSNGTPNTIDFKDIYIREVIE